MDLYDSRYFSINKFLCKCIGIWPFDPTTKYFFSSFTVVASIFFMLPHFIGLVVNRSDIDRFMEHTCLSIFLVMITAKLVSVLIAEKKMKMMFNDIIDNWISIDDEQEKRILQYYSNRGRILTIGYMGYIATVGMFFVVLPMAATVINELRLSSEPLPRLFLMNAEFLVDRNEHYWKIYFWDVSRTIIPALIVVGVDTMYIACVEHCVGLFAIVRHRLQTLNGSFSNAESTANKGADILYDRMKNIIRLHQRVLRFVDTLQAAYSLGFLVIMIFNLILIPLICVMIIMNSNQMIQSVRYFFLFTGLAVHLLYISVGAQRIIDASSDFLSDAFQSEWYEGSKKTKRAMEFFMLRCTQPSMLTAGGMMIMGMKTFLKIMKTALSYITVFSLFR